MFDNISAPHSQLRISVIVPAKDEEEYILATIQALYHQTNDRGNHLDFSSYEVLVLANNCSDNTAEVVRHFTQQHPEMALHLIEHDFPSHQANIGYVRRILMDTAWNRLMRVGKPEGVIASTDGDTIVDTTWIYHILAAIDHGADAVGGRILTLAQPGSHRLYYLQDITYRYLQAWLESKIDPDPHDPWPRHFQNFGPSLAVTCSMYERAGRLPVVPYLEDVHFYEAMQRCDARIRHCPKVRVATSSRLEGRVGFGFSKQLETWSMMQQQQITFQVPNADEWLFRFQLQQRLRMAWQKQSYSMLLAIADQVGISIEHFYDVMVRSTYCGEFLFAVMRSETMQEYLNNTYPWVSITEAIRQLRWLLHQNGTKPLMPNLLRSSPTGQSGTVQLDDGRGVVASQ